MEQEKNETYFVNVHDRLTKELTRVRKYIAFYTRWTKENFHNVYDQLTPEEQDRRRNIINSFQWEYYYDKEQELVEQINRNMADYGNYHFIKYGWSVIL